MPTYALNTTNNAVTEYHNYNFSSFCSFRGRGYGASATGINRLDQGERDNDTPVPAHITVAQTHFTGLNEKRIRSVFISAAIENDMLFIVKSNTGHVETYTVKDSYNDLALRRHKVPCRRQGTRGASFTLSLSNNGDGYFVLSAIEVVIILLQRR